MTSKIVKITTPKEVNKYDYDMLFCMFIACVLTTLTYVVGGWLWALFFASASSICFMYAYSKIEIEREITQAVIEEVKKR